MRLFLSFLCAVMALRGCVAPQETRTLKTDVIFDTDTNNELDDQHALAYLLFNGAAFNVLGVTVNATRSGGDIDQQYAEAERVMRLCGFHDQLPLYKGANGSFDLIAKDAGKNNFDGAPAVNFIIGAARAYKDGKLTIIAVGKLTNVALALAKAPAIQDNLRVVWLGSNYPEPGEYNQDNDTASLNYVLRSKVDFEMVTVRYGKPSGTAAVTVTQEEINNRMPGRGPEVIIPVEGRHGGQFNTFGDYSVNLFRHIDYYSTPPSRALFDMVAVAIVKNPEWAERKTIPAPVLVSNKWVEQPGNARTITVWENFNRAAIIEDFFNTMDVYQLADTQ